MAKQLTKEEHFNRVGRNANIKRGKGTQKQIFYVMQGSVGNRTLGSIDYLNTQGFQFRIISETRFKNL